jgi:hypothetical protein
VSSRVELARLRLDARIRRIFQPIFDRARRRSNSVSGGIRAIFGWVGVG